MPKKNEKWPVIAEIMRVSFKMGNFESKFSFLRTSLRFYSALAMLETQICLVVEQFGAENISLLSGRLVIYSTATVDLIGLFCSAAKCQ